MRAVLALIVATLLGLGLAETLIVYPFSSQDALAGVALADRLAQAFEGQAEVIGPETAPSLVPPLVVDGGFINPALFLGQVGFANSTGAALLRDAVGADWAVTGELVFEDEAVVLTLYVKGDSSATLTFAAPLDDPSRLLRPATFALAARLGVVPEPASEFDLAGPFGDHVRIVGLIGAGLVDEALAQLEGLKNQGTELLPETAALYQNLTAMLAGEAVADAALAAVASITIEQFDEAQAIGYFEAFREASALPVADVWIGALAASVNDKARAVEALDSASAAYSYGRIARASYRQTNGLEGSSEDIAAVVAGGLDSGVAGLLGLAVVADQGNDRALEKQALQLLARAAPFFPYPFERLSFIAFDEDDGAAAAEVLVVAVELDPASDLYWTNLGWAYYLVGLLPESEDASIRATELDPNQFIARYNLGLVRVVTGRLELALDDYAIAMRFDREVDDEAIVDLENALDLYPDESGIHFALANLYQAEGRRAEAADQYERYLERDDGERPALAATAASRVEALRAPPPPIEIIGGVDVSLGFEGVEASPYHPGEDVFLNFEVTTLGDILPQRIQVTVALVEADGTVVDTSEADIEVPTGAIGFVIDDASVALPEGLSPGTYRLDVTVAADAGRASTETILLAVDGRPELLRQLLGRNIVMQALDAGRSLYDERDLSRPGVLADRLVGELQGAANAAEEALPVVEGGRFEGLSGGELFLQSGVGEIEDFLHFLLAQGTSDITFTFVDAYAQWALDGGPQE